MAAYYLKAFIVLIVLSVIIPNVASNNVYIATSPKQCPQQDTTCLTLQQYINGNYTTNSTSLQVLSGIHRIYSNDTNISVSNIYSFKVNGINATVLCNNNYLKFGKINVISIRGVRLVGCIGASFSTVRVLSIHSTHFEHHGPVIMNSISNAMIINSSIINGCKLLVHNSTLLIKATLFSNLTISDDYNKCRQDPYGGAIRMDNSNVIIEESMFTINGAYCVNGGWGGAVYANNTILHIVYSYFTGNLAYVGGGAISADHSQLQVNGSYFSNNTALENGGAIQLQHATHTGINYCHFIQNKANQAGALYVVGNYSTVNIFQSTFDDNGANITGGTLYTMGNRNIVVIYRSEFLNSRAQEGGTLSFIGSNSSIYIDTSNFMNSKAVQMGGVLQVLGDSTSIIIHLCNFNNNTADVAGGAIYLKGYLSRFHLTDSTFSNHSANRCAVLEVMEAAYVYLINGTFTHNIAKLGNISGGVACIKNTSIYITNSTFYRNVAVGNAGVLSIEDSYILAILDTFFNSNRAGCNGGVAYIRNTYSTAISNSSFQRNEASENAGVLYIDNSNLSIFNSSFSSNIAGHNGGVIYWNTTLSSKSISVEIFHSDFFSNQAAKDGGVMHASSKGSQVTITNSTFANNNATGRGGVIAITGSQLHFDQNTIFYNMASYGSVISACRTNVTDSDDLAQIVEPTANDSDCSFYNEYRNMPTTNTTTMKTTEVISTSRPSEASTTSPTSLSETTTTTATTTPKTNTKPETNETPTSAHITTIDDHSRMPTIPGIYATAIYTTLGIAIVVCVLLALLYIIVLCIMLYLCGAFKSKKRLVDNPYVYVPMKENESTTNDESAPK